MSTTAPTTPTETGDPGTEAPTGSQGVPGGEPPPESGERERGEDGRLLSREAAGYRRRLRDAEQARDQLRERLERYERAEVERIAGQSGLAVASDIWLHGASVQNLRTEDGSIDQPTVEALVQDLLKSRPGLQAQRVGNLGIGHGGTTPGAGAKPGLSALLKP